MEGTSQQRSACIQQLCQGIEPQLPQPMRDADVIAIPEQSRWEGTKGLFWNCWQVGIYVCQGRNPSTYLRLVPLSIISLPYLTDVNVALGLVAKHYLEQTGPDALQATESAFPTCASVKNDLDKGFQFWKGLVTGLEAVRDAKYLSEETYAMFVEADQWLQTKRK